MNKFIIVLITVFLASGSAFPLDIELTGEIKTGLFFEEREHDGTTYSHARIHNNDGDSGSSEGRLRIGFNLQMEDFGIRTRFDQHNFSRGTSVNDRNITKVVIDYAYAYGYLFDRQFKISAGLLGESPWGSGGPEIFRELEYTVNNDPITGLRFEWMPNFLPGLNLGFVFNRDDDSMPAGAKEYFGDMFMESVVGIAYEHDFFALSFAYRFDRDVDSPAAVVTGSKLVYRVEERILGKLLPGMSISANGYGEGLNAEGRKGSGRSTPGFLQNWLYIHYDPDFCSAGINAGYRDGFILNEQKFEFNPFFYYKLFGLFSVGLMAGIEIGFNNGKSFDDIFYNFWFIEPQVNINISSNFYAALLYRYTEGSYETENAKFRNKDQTTHWFNLRLCYTF